MMSQFHHVSVLLSETIRGLNIKPGGTYVDGTLGGAGHSSEILKYLGAEGCLIGIDQDPAALEAAKRRLGDSKAKVLLLKGNFENVKQLLMNEEVLNVDGILFDLGVSSHQLDTPERGFSYNQKGPLDMRMDPSSSLSADQIIHDWSEEEITRILFEYGEEKFARRIARQIIKRREIERIADTLDLAEVIKNAIPAAARRKGPHPAKRSFQALRIAVNKELTILEKAFSDGIDLLKPGGRICVITFHSLEDRITKNLFSKFANPCICPPKLPMCVCGKKPTVKIIGKVQSPGLEELELNPRARSAKLRIAEKLNLDEMEESI